MGLWTPYLMHVSLGPRKSSTQNGISIGSAIFAGLTSVTDKPTDNSTQSVAIGHIYIRSTAMRPNENNDSVSTD